MVIEEFAQVQQHPPIIAGNLTTSIEMDHSCHLIPFHACASLGNLENWR